MKIVSLIFFEEAEISFEKVTTCQDFLNIYAANSQS